MALPTKNSFVASLFAVALCAIAVSGIDIAENIAYWRYGQPAVMSLADPGKRYVSYEDDTNWTVRDVMYSSEAGVVQMPGRTVSKEVAKRLDLGSSIPIVYMTNNPKRIFYDGRTPESPWLWLGIGIVVLATAIVALRLRKREAFE